MLTTDAQSPADNPARSDSDAFKMSQSDRGAGVRELRDCGRKAEASKDQTLATASLNAAAGEWLDIELRTEGEKVLATIGKSAKLEASDPTFSVAKPTVVFRVIGGDMQLDDVQVTVLKAGEIKPVEKKAAKKG